MSVLHVHVILACLMVKICAQQAQWRRLYDGAGDKVQPAEGFGAALSSLGAVQNSSALSIIRFGGQGYEGSLPAIFGTSWWFDATWGWSKLPTASPSPPPRTRMCLVPAQEATSGDSLLVFGGRYALAHLPENLMVDFNDVWELKLNTGVWRRLHSGGVGDSFPGARSGAGCALRGNYLLVYGGMTWVGTLYSDTWAFHVPSGTWARVSTQGTSPPPSFGMSAVYVPPTTYLGTSAIRGDVFILHGGRTTGNVAMTSLATVLDGTFVLVLFPDGRPREGVPSSRVSVPLQGTWHKVRVSSNEEGGSPRRAFAQAVVWNSGSTTLVCQHGGSDFVGYGEHTTSEVVCLDAGPLLDWLAAGAPPPPGTPLASLSSPSTPEPFDPQLHWFQLSVATCSGSLDPPCAPAARQRGAVLFDQGTRTLVIHGGCSQDIPMPDTWAVILPPFTFTIGSAGRGSGLTPSPSTGTPLEAWTLFKQPVENSVLYLSWVAFAGLGAMIVAAGLLVLLRNVETRARRILLERRMEEERRRQPFGADGASSFPRRGLEQAIIDAIPTMMYAERECSVLSPFACEGGAVKKRLSVVHDSLTVQGPDVALSLPGALERVEDVSCPGDACTVDVPEGRRAPAALVLRMPGAIVSNPARAPGPHSLEAAFDPEQQTGCAICICDFVPGDILKVLPCLHRYHGEPCLSTWLKDHTTCPLCKFNIQAAVL